MAEGGEVVVVGGGLAGSEAAWQAARRGCRVTLFEMRPEVMTPAHRTGLLAELVCSNSLRSDAPDNAVGLLKEEMRRLGSLIMDAADATRVPAGKALAVDRERFAARVTERLAACPLVRIARREVTAIPASRPVVIATGPLTSQALSGAIQGLVGEDYLHFYDAIAPIVVAASIDRGRVFLASRYGHRASSPEAPGTPRTEGDYLNCPLDRDEYLRFWTALSGAKTHPRREFEAGTPFFEGCLPVEELARRGPDTLRFGPMKPVGLVDPSSGRRPYAVVQLRPENRDATLYNLVGFQTSLTWPEQQRVFRLIPGLERAEFVRLGAMHRNTFINSPRLLAPTLQLRADPRLLFAGQMTGVEGYVESAAMGLVAGINAARLVHGRDPLAFPRETACGALGHYIVDADPAHFQPMNVNFGILPPPEREVRGRAERARDLAERARAALSRVLPACADGLTGGGDGPRLE
jgi:methylenetetrahydrofolate--tRNA-(uracil-5-)-methyltransferase